MSLVKARAELFRGAQIKKSTALSELKKKKIVVSRDLWTTNRLKKGRREVSKCEPQREGGRRYCM